MSLFRNIFGGGKKAAPVAGPQEAIQRLRETEDMLIKKQEFLENKISAVSGAFIFFCLIAFGKLLVFSK